MRGVHPERLELPTYGSVDHCSIQLSYGCKLVCDKQRRKRDSNPRWALTHTPLAGERLQPLGHFSTLAFASKLVPVSRLLWVAMRPQHLGTERVGFEPTKHSRTRRFSRPVPSTARPPLQVEVSGTADVYATKVGGVQAFFRIPCRVRRGASPKKTQPDGYRLGDKRLSVGVPTGGCGAERFTRINSASR